MNDEHAFVAAGGPIVARGPKTFRVECPDPQAARQFFANQTNARRSHEAAWKPIGAIRREDLHQLLDEWLDSMESA